MTPAKFVVCILLATALALAVVYQSTTLRRAGYRLEEVRREIAEEKADYAVHEAHVCKLRSPQRILALAERLGLNLERPTPEQSAPAGRGSGQGAQDVRQNAAPPAEWPEPAPGTRVVDASGF
jgi:hypothetical protein